MIAGRLSLNYGKYMAGVSAALLTLKNLKPTELASADVSDVSNATVATAKNCEELATDVSITTASAKTCEKRQ